MWGSPTSSGVCCCLVVPTLENSSSRTFGSFLRPVLSSCQLPLRLGKLSENEFEKGHVIIGMSTFVSFVKVIVVIRRKIQRVWVCGRRWVSGCQCQYRGYRHAQDAVQQIQAKLQSQAGSHTQHCMSNAKHSSLKRRQSVPRSLR